MRWKGLKDADRQSRAANGVKAQQYNRALDAVYLTLHAQVSAMNQLKNAGGESRIAANEFNDLPGRGDVVPGHFQNAHCDGRQSRKILQLLEDEFDPFLSQV